jgi:tetratricopeptide (TPR) repeat protein
VSNLLIGALGALLATNQPAAISNLVVKETGISITSTNDPVEMELQKVMEEEDKAQAEVDKWIQDNEKFAAQGAGESNDSMNRRIMARFESVRKGYEDFLSRHTNHASGELAFAGFLTDIGEEPDSVPHLEKALKLDPQNPAVWNNLANYYGHFGEPKKAFEYYGKAISLNPNEAVYFQNFGTTVFLFRKDAMEYYHIKEQKVFDKALDLYSKALKVAPDDFPLATDVAQTYYGIKPLRAEDALAAWTNAFKVARDEIEREGVQLHFARLKWMAGRTNEARAHLGMITNQMYAELKRVITKNLERPPPDWSKPLSSIPDPPEAEKKP